MSVKWMGGIVVVLVTCSVARTATLEFNCLQDEPTALNELDSIDVPVCPLTPTDAVTCGGLADFDPLPGDANGDGKVNFQDLVIFACDYGLHGPDLPADFNRDGCVNFADLVILAQNYGSCRGPVTPAGSPAEAPLPPVAPAGALLLVIVGAARWMRVAKPAGIRDSRPPPTAG